MLSATMRSALTQPLRPCARGLQAKSLLSRGALVGRSFLIASSYKSRVAVRGFATATASKTTGRTAAKKPATKTKTNSKSKATTIKAKKTAKAPAKKKAAAKPKKPVVKKKEIDPEKKKILLRRALKKTALLNQEPKNLPAHPWLVFLTRNVQGEKIAGPKGMAQRIQAISAEFKGLSPAQLEDLQETARQNKAINAGHYKTWVESHSVADILAANNARRRLKRDFNLNVKPSKVVDERVPKRPASGPFAYFTKAKRSDVPGKPFGTHARELAQQWRALSQAEKKPYLDLASA
ncbi:hypothetical protein diail_3629, partial [Diaporthe ilicicola]